MVVGQHGKRHLGTILSQVNQIVDRRKAAAVEQIATLELLQTKRPRSGWRRGSKDEAKGEKHGPIPHAGKF
jgi:hypothetical protein